MMSSSTDKKKLPIIGITLGDPAGIGPEVTAKAIKKSSIRGLGHFVIIGDYKIFRRYNPNTYTNCRFFNLPSKVSLIPGKPTRHSAEASLLYLNQAIDLLKGGALDSLVTAPVCKETISSLGNNFIGHTEHLAHAFKVKDYDMMYVSKQLKVIILTRHIPLRDVCRQITQKKVLASVSLAYKALKNQFGIRNPKIAVCGLNPHAGEGGTIGKEDMSKILPAIRKAQKLGMSVHGPFSADTIFVPRISKQYDLILSMYHDQGTIPIKTLAFDQLVNLTIGLPFIRTSPAHGTAFNIAGKNKSDSTSMCEAIKLAAWLA